MTQSTSSSFESFASVFAAARTSGRIGTGDRAAIFHDLDRMESRLERLETAFPDGTLHAVAIKANPLVGLLERLVDAGAGLEAASIEEVRLALEVDCPPETIAFDSPAKTRGELERALDRGLLLNADNLDELERIDTLVDDADGPVRAGLRVNPLVGSGSIEATSVSNRDSKFGVPLEPNRAEIRRAFEHCDWLCGLHLHVGSQGYELTRLVEGVRRAWAFGREIDDETPTGLETFDIGGGLPVAYRDDHQPPTFEDYADALADAVPELFDRDIQLITEFGRALQVPCGWAASRVEYTKQTAGGPLAATHLGADFMLRRAYQPEHWYHRMAVLEPDGTLKRGVDDETWTIAGPLCFSGDVMGRDVALPPIEPGDWILYRDVGGYTLGMWSRYCSRALPPVWGHRGTSLELLREGETEADVVDFWDSPDR
jgi:diaminopimelate decarboxylase